MRITILLLLLVFASEARAQKQGLSGRDLFAACAFQDSLMAGEAPKSQVSISDALMQGMCLGMISGVRFFAETATRDTALAACIPESVSTRQINSVVVRYMRAHPERLHENFFVLAVTASAETWPCASGSPPFQ